MSEEDRRPDTPGSLRPSLQRDKAVQHPKVVSFRRESLSRDRPGTLNLSEQSPLLGSNNRDGPSLKIISPMRSPNREIDSWDEEAEKTKKTPWLMMLTVCMLGLTIAWSVELSYGSPYLLSLGLSKSLLAFVWIAGPLSGALVQPYVGIKSDNARFKLGKRRPFMVGGAIFSILALLALGWTKEIVRGVLGLFGVDPEAKVVYTVSMVTAVILIYVLDFAINVVQAAIRAFIVDCAPTHQQEEANAWAIRMGGIGNILGYLSGYVNLPRLFPFLGNTQFKVLCVIAVIAFAITLVVSCVGVKERDASKDKPAEAEEGVVAFFRNIYNAIGRLPPQVRSVCVVQLFAWVGWFPFLFYTTTYIAEIYVDPVFEKNPNMTDDEINKTWEKGTRIGTFALLIFALTTFAASVILPVLVEPTFKAPETAMATPMTPTTPGSLSASGYFERRKPKKKKRLSWRRWNKFLRKFQIPGFTLRRAWLLSHILFAACMWLTFVVKNTQVATVLVALIGIPWALTNWAPFALISAELSKRDAIRRGLIPPPPTRDGQLLAENEDDSADQAGIVLGIHNVAIAAPQALATIMSSVIFKALQKPRGTPGDNSVAWVLRMGGFFALAAAYFTLRVGEEKEDQGDDDTP